MAPHYLRILPFILFETSLWFSLSIPWASPLKFNFPSIKILDGDTSIQLLGDASISNSGCIQLTKSEAYQSLNFSIGRATYSKQVHLWDKRTQKLTDFTTHFSFVIQSGKNDEKPGDGLLFFLTDKKNSASISNSTAGGGLGLFNRSGTSHSNYTVAVEFDTWKNEWDPDRKHIGIDINSIRSANTVRWNTSMKDEGKATVLVTYNSSLHLLSVFLTNNSNTKFNEFSPILNHSIDLRDYLPEWVTVGFSAATGHATELHEICSWDFSSSLDNKMMLVMKILVPCGAAGIVGGFVLVWCLMRRKKQESEAEDDDDDDDDADDDVVLSDATMDDELETGPRRFSYAELARATNNFNEGGKLGEGGFGGVYRGYLSDLNLDVAVKRISKGSKQGIKEFMSEVKIISRLRHKNLVQLVGWCHQRRELLLVYEFMPNGSLDSHLFGTRVGSIMSWQLRYKIALDLASALLYLHEEWEQCIIHRDVKSSNVILDSNFNAKLGDFGLARLVDHGKESQTTVLAGTLGYMAPECVMTGKASKESDVYSFGIVALEIACGRRPIEMNITDPTKVRLVGWVWDLYERGKLLEAGDPSQLGVDFNEKQQMLENLLIVGLWCVHPDYNLRPSIRQALHVLNFDAPLPILPPKMPVPTYFSSSSSVSAFAITSSHGTTNTQSSCSS